MLTKNGFHRFLFHFLEVLYTKITDCGKATKPNVIMKFMHPSTTFWSMKWYYVFFSFHLSIYQMELIKVRMCFNFTTILSVFHSFILWIYRRTALYISLILHKDRMFIMMLYFTLHVCLLLSPVWRTLYFFHCALFMVMSGTYPGYPLSSTLPLYESIH